jgi:hypothetical protein
VPEQPVRYQSPDEDSGRWTGFPFRPGDIVISTRSKSGTTWAQMICALLIFQRADLPARLGDLSPFCRGHVRSRGRGADDGGAGRGRASYRRACAAGPAHVAVPCPS